MYKLIVGITLTLVSLAMAWRSSSNSNSGLIDQLKQNGIIQSAVVEEALKKVDRAQYVDSRNPYLDAPQLIGCDQTISAPHMHGIALETLRDVITIPNANLLDIGVGSGYLAACMARMNPSARVYGIDIVPNLVEYALRNVRKQDKDLLEPNSLGGRLEIVVGDGWKSFDGIKFNGIHVGAAAETLPPQLLHQLAIGGKLIIPIGQQGEVQTLIECTKLSDDLDFNKAYNIKTLLTVQYVPLVRDT